MSSPKPVIQIVAPPGSDTADVAEPLAKAGFDVRHQDLTPQSPSLGVKGEIHLPPPLPPREGGPGGLGSAPPAVVLVLVESAPEPAVAFTRRFRADTTSDPRPVLWLLTVDPLAVAILGLDAGADACLVRPVDDDLLVAQVNALLRTHRSVTRFAAKGADAHDLTDRLQKLYRTGEAETALARKAVAEFTPRTGVTVADLVVGWWTRPAARGGVGVFDVWPGGDGVLRLVLVEVGGLGTSVGAVLASEAARTLLRETIPGSPKTALAAMNRKLIEMRLPDAAVVSAAVGVVHAESGRVTVACAGLPSPVLVPADGPACVWHGSGPFLGTADTEFHDITGQLNRGEKVVLMAGGAVADRRPDVRAAAESHRTLAAQPFADAMAKELLTDADPDDGFTLLAVERAAEPSGTMAQTAETQP